MTVLDDLASIDLSAIVQGRATISTAISAADLERLLSDIGIGPLALGELGAALDALRQAAEGHPEALLRPLVDAVAGLGTALHIGDLPIGSYHEAVKEGAALLSGLLAGLDGDAAAFGQALGRSLGDNLGAMASAAGDYAAAGLGDLAGFSQLVAQLERGVPTDPAGFALAAVQALLPFPGPTLTSLREGVDLVVAGAAAVTLPSGRSGGLLAALDAVTVAAAGGDGNALRRALADLDRARANTLAVLGDDLRAVGTAIDGLGLGGRLDRLAAACDGLRGAEQGVLEFLDDLRRQLADARQHLDDFDVSQLAPVLLAIIDQVEAEAEARLGGAVDAAVARAEEWLRGLLDHLGLRALRDELSAFLHGAARAVADAGLDGPARTVHEQLARVRSALDPARLTADVRQVLADADETIGRALDGVIGALAAIGTRIGEVAGQVRPIMEDAAAALASFKTAIDQLDAAVANLGIEAAGEQVVDAIVKLRETAQAVLTVAPLPDTLRPAVEQLIGAVDAIDLEESLEKPVKEVVDQLKIPDSFKDSLKRVRAAVRNLVPSQVIADIQGEVDEALAKLRGFDVTELLGSVTGFLHEMADMLDSLDLTAAAAAIRGPFDAVASAAAAVRPAALLAPAVTAWDELLGAIPVPDPDTATRRVAQTVGAAGEGIGRTLLAPATQLASGSVDLAPSPGAGAAGAAVTGAPSPEDLVRPGDVIRLFGYLPDLLRRALAGLEAGPAGAALRAVDGLCGGLAGDLRALEAGLLQLEDRLAAGIDELLAPLALAQARAQLSLAAHATLHAGAVDVDASMVAIAGAGPGPLREELAGAIAQALGQAREAAGTAGGNVGAALERAANALDRCRLAGITGDLDAFLAALDPEPLAAELDAFTAAALAKAPQLISGLGGALKEVEERLRALLAALNPGALAQRFLPLVAVLREQLDLLDPRRLAAELGEVHQAVVDAIAAYDPAVLASELTTTLSTLSASLRAIDPAALLGDTTPLQATIRRIEDAVPSAALQGIGADLRAVGEQLDEIDLDKLIDDVNALGPKVEAAFDQVVESLKAEILTLLHALRFATASGGAGVSGGVSVGGG